MTAAGLWNRDLQVWRRTTQRDPGGGQSETWVQVGTIPARVSQPTSAQRAAAQRDGVDLTDVVYTDPDSDVRRGDELRDPGSALVFPVKAVVGPSEAVYLRADCDRRQSEGSG